MATALVTAGDTVSGSNPHVPGIHPAISMYSNSSILRDSFAGTARLSVLVLPTQGFGVLGKFADPSSLLLKQWNPLTGFAIENVGAPISIPGLGSAPRTMSSVGGD